MTSRAKKNIDEALALPKEELVDVVVELQQRVVADSKANVDAAWNAEIVRCVRAIQAGNAVLLDGDEVDRELAGILEEG